MPLADDTNDDKRFNVFSFICNIAKRAHKYKCEEISFKKTLIFIPAVEYLT